MKIIPVEIIKGIYFFKRHFFLYQKGSMKYRNEMLQTELNSALRNETGNRPVLKQNFD